MRRVLLIAFMMACSLIVSAACGSQTPAATNPASPTPAPTAATTATSAPTPAPTVAPTATSAPTLAPTAAPAATPSPTLAPTPPPVATAKPTGAATATRAGTGTGTENEFEDFNPANFDRSAIIDNEWFPLQPGMKFVYDGYTTEAGERIPRRVVFIVTNLTKVLSGVRSVVILDTDYVDGVLRETELTFFAQDKDRNVWQLGEYSEIYEDRELVGGRTWLVGYLEGARAGIMMPASPRLGTPSYSEGFAPAPIYWSDRGRVIQVGQKTKVPAGSYDDVLVIEEFNAEEPNAFQLKYYARGVGIVRVGWRGEDANQEELELVELVQLDAAGLAQTRAEALELETRAYVYGGTPPAE